MAIPNSAKFKYTVNQKYTIPTGYAGPYARGKGKPDGIVYHSSGNRNANFLSEINFMTRNFKNAFTSAWANYNEIREIASTDYRQWGVGPKGNPYYVQIEMTEDKNLTDKQHLQVIDRTAFWGAVQLAYYNLPCTNAENTGKGTVWSHNAVSKFKGGTDHVDPIAYLQRHGSNWTELFNQTKAYYDILVAGGDTNRVVSIADKQGNKAVIKDSASSASKVTESQKVSENKATHTVVKGDTLWKIGQTYGVTVSKIKSWNNLKSDTLSIGQVLKVKESDAVVKKNTNTAGSSLQKYVGNEGKWSKMKVGDTVTIRAGAKNWVKPADKVYAPMSKDFKGTKDEIAEIKEFKVGYSDYAYKLKKLNSWILQQDLEEPREVNNWTVSKGDTLYKIASTTGTTVDNIKKWNNLKSDVLSIGQEIKLSPSDSSAPQEKPKEVVKETPKEEVKETPKETPKEEPKDKADNEVVVGDKSYTATALKPNEILLDGKKYRVEEVKD